MQSGPVWITQEPNGIDVGVEVYADEVGDDGAPDPDLDGVGTVAREAAQRVVLLDPLEELLDVPAAHVDFRDGGGPQVQVVGRKAEEAAGGPMVVVDDPGRHAVTARSQQHQLVTVHAGLSLRVIHGQVPGQLHAHAIVQVGHPWVHWSLHACHCSKLVEPMSKASTEPLANGTPAMAAMLLRQPSVRSM